MINRTDCRHFRASEPCRPHKELGVVCDGCRVYDPIVERILIVKLGALGDVLRTTSCLAPLKAHYPQSHITWVTRANARAVLADIPTVDRLLTIEENYLELLMAEEFDLAIGPEADVLSGSIMRLAHADEKRGFITDGRGGVHPLGDAARAWWQTGLNDAIKRRNRRTYGEWLYDVCALPTPIARPVLAVSPAAGSRVSEFFNQKTGSASSRICVNTGASGRWREKRWKRAHYCELARLIAIDQSNTALILIGGPEETAFNRQLIEADVGFIDGGTDRSVEEFGAIISACDWVLTPDSLGYHVACAVGTPAVCLVGPTSPWELDRYGQNLVLHSDLPCIGCYLAECPLPRSCMDALTASTVWRHVRQWRDGLGTSEVATDRVVSALVADDP